MSAQNIIGLQRVTWQPMSQNDWSKYYGIEQGGRGMTFFRGSRHQRGNGFGSFFSGLMRAVLPTAKSALKAVGKQALRTGVEVASDVLGGENIKTALKTRGKQAGQQLVGKAHKVINKKTAAGKKPQQTGRGLGKRTAQQRKKPVGRPIAKRGRSSRRKPTDVFSNI